MFSIVVRLFVIPKHIERICMRYASGSDFSVTLNINSSYMRSKTRFFISNIITVLLFLNNIYSDPVAVIGMQTLQCTVICQLPYQLNLTAAIC